MKTRKLMFVSIMTSRDIVWAWQCECGAVNSDIHAYCQFCGR